MMRRVRLCGLLFTGLLVSGAAQIHGQAKAFPTAEGFGAVSVGGRGGAVIEVINLDDAGTGSFRACAEGTGPRTCVFRIGGVINLSDHIHIYEANSFLTIAGQTAPGPGITLTPWPINIANGAHDIIIRHLRHRQAYASEPPNGNSDCGGIIVYGPGSQRTYNVIIDHASVAYACDDTTQGYAYVTDTTLQWSLLGEGYESVFGDGFGSSKGFITGGSNPESAFTSFSFHHNMILHSASRNPYVGPSGVLDFRNNLIYNWWACRGSVGIGTNNNNISTSVPTNVNFVGNVYLAGPNTDPISDPPNPDACWLGSIYPESPAHIYVQDNATPYCGGMACPAGTFNIGWGKGGAGESYPASEATYRVGTPHTAPAIAMTPRTTLESVLAPKVGAIVPLRDSLDTRLLSELQARTGNVGRQGASFPTLATSTAAPTDTDHDGMPDSWETSHGLNPNNSADRNGVPTPANGYTNLELYLNELAGDGAAAAPLASTDLVQGILPFLNRQHPLAKGLIVFLYGAPSYTGGTRYYNLAGPTPGALGGFATPNWVAIPSLPGIKTVTFDGVDDRVTLTSSTELQPPKLTWVVFAKSMSSAQNQFAQLLGKGNSFDLTANPNGGDSTQTACYVNNTDVVQAITPSGSLPLNTWTWAGCTFDPSRAAPQLRAFRNGLLVAGANSTLAVPYSGDDWFFGGDSAGAATFAGAIGPVLVWNYALSDMQMAQVQQLARTQFAGLLRIPQTPGFVPQVLSGGKGGFLPFFQER
jgi:pectate lyase